MKNIANEIHIDSLPQEIRDDLKTQLSELTKKTGITIHKLTGEKKGRYGSVAYDVYKKRGVLAISEDATKGNTLLKSSIDSEKNYQTWLENNTDAEETQKQTVYNNLKKYTHFSYPGNGSRNATIDHEFYHYLEAERACNNINLKHEEFGKDDKEFLYRRKVFRDLDDKCQTFCNERNFSYYGGYSGGIGESSAETYSYWKSGNTIPKPIEELFIKMEDNDPTLYTHYLFSSSEVGC